MVNTSCLFRAIPSLALLLVLSPNLLSGRKSADSFDKPHQKKVVDAGPASFSPPGWDIRAKVSCYFYPRFMVKEFDEGAKGDEISIVPAEKGAAPACTRERALGEWVAVESGRFKGARANLVFIDAPDTKDGGLPFVVYDSTTRKKIFQDSAYQSESLGKKEENSPFNRLQIIKGHGGKWLLRYFRVVATDCDLHLGEAPCWQNIQKTLDVQNLHMPACRGYGGIQDRLVSVVGYPVEVSLFPQPTIRTMAGPVRCWPVD